MEKAFDAMTALIFLLRLAFAATVAAWIERDGPLTLRPAELARMGIGGARCES